MGLVRGEDVILTMAEYQDGVGYVYIPIGCARSVTFDISTDFIETSVTDSGAFKTFLPSGKQYTGNIEGLVFLDKPKVSEIKATSTLDLTDISDSVSFPTTGELNASIYANESLSVQELLFVTLTGTFATFADFLTYVNNGINSGSSGYTSVISGNSLIITARPGLGASINGFISLCNYFISSTSYFTNGTAFSGGVDGYFPAKYNLGLMYSKIISGEILGLKYYETDDDNHFLQKECEVYIESINETASFDNMVTFSAQFKGTGAPTITYGED